jgi:hypothetical protein
VCAKCVCVCAHACTHVLRWPHPVHLMWSVLATNAHPLPNHTHPPTHQPSRPPPDAALLPSDGGEEYAALRAEFIPPPMPRKRKEGQPEAQGRGGRGGGKRAKVRWRGQARSGSGSEGREEGEGNRWGDVRACVRACVFCGWHRCVEPLCGICLLPRLHPPLKTLPLTLCPSHALSPPPPIRFHLPLSAAPSPDQKRIKRFSSTLLPLRTHPHPMPHPFSLQGHPTPTPILTLALPLTPLHPCSNRDWRASDDIFMLAAAAAAQNDSADPSLHSAHSVDSLAPPAPPKRAKRAAASGVARVTAALMHGGGMGDFWGVDGEEGGQWGEYSSSYGGSEEEEEEEEDEEEGEGEGGGLGGPEHYAPGQVGGRRGAQRKLSTSEAGSRRPQSTHHQDPPGVLPSAEQVNAGTLFCFAFECAPSETYPCKGQRVLGFWVCGPSASPIHSYLCMRPLHIHAHATL